MTLWESSRRMLWRVSLEDLPKVMTLPTADCCQYTKSSRWDRGVGCSHFGLALLLRRILSALMVTVLMHQEQSDLPLGQAVS